MNNELQTMEEQHVEVMQVSNAESLAALTRSEIDVQIATAKQYPRNLARVLGNIETLATMDEEVAGSCFYTLRRQGKVIEGASVRMAEIIASSWGNLRVQARIIGNDGKMITAQGVCHDLESNYAVSAEVKRRITDKNGHTFSEDMQMPVALMRKHEVSELKLSCIKHQHDYHEYYKLELKNEIPLDDYSRWANSTKWEK